MANGFPLWPPDRVAFSASNTEFRTPSDVAALISRRTSLLLISMGAGAGGDAQYLFACDVLGYNRGHIPEPVRIFVCGA